MRIAASWSCIKKWYANHVPASVVSFSQGATSFDVAALEEAVGDELPGGFKESLLICNGVGGCGLLHYGELHSTIQIEKSWRSLCHRQVLDGFGQHWDGLDLVTVDPGIERFFWNPSRIPVSYDFGGNYVLLDLNPTKNGTRGQMIWLEHEAGPRTILASSMGSWLAQICMDLGAGKYCYSEEDETVLPSNW